VATFVLIHGAGDVGWYWHLVDAELRARGHEAISPDLPCDDDSAGLPEYADTVAGAIGDRTDLIVVAQSFGGFTAPLVCDRVAVNLLVLVAPMIPAPGESSDGPDRQAPEVRLPGPYELGQEFYRWEFATAVAGSILQINPFDQPDVQAAKDKTNEVLAGGGNPDVEPRGSLDELFAQAQPGDYVAIQAFIDPAREEELKPLIERARAETGCVVTHNLGPRYLHSTGQLHKGGPNTGLFVQVVDDPGKEVSIPGRKFGFRRLIQAQAAADFASLEERGRRIVRVRLEDL
jgi:pimeloyl-ACP methyl ester carboxylesterase